MKNDFYIFRSGDLDKFDPLVTLVQRYVFTKLEVSKSFLFRENWRHGMDGQTDRRSVTLNAAH